MGNFLVFWPLGLDLGLKARIWASSLGFGPQDWFEGGGVEKKKKEKEKIPHMCKAWVINPFGSTAQKGNKNIE